MSQSKSILFRCDVSPSTGYGHGVRCLALARRLRDDHGINATFATLSPDYGEPFFGDDGFAVVAPDRTGDLNEDAWFLELVRTRPAAPVVVDIRTELGPQTLRALRSEGYRFAVIDDPSNRRLEADWAFCPPVPQVQEMSWDGLAGTLFAGWDWVLLRDSFVTARERAKDQTVGSVRRNILVTLGGSDPYGLSGDTVAALDACDGALTLNVLVGPGFGDHDRLSEAIDASKHDVSVVTDPADVPGLMLDHHVAIAAFGMTAYELATLGVPAIYVTVDEDHARSASAFVDAGMGIAVTDADVRGGNGLASTLNDMFADPQRLLDMTRTGRETVDGGGAARISAILAAALEAA